MKKKNLVILLIMPFLIALFGIATIKTAFNIIENDVVSISWNYAENELFEVGSTIPLSASRTIADERFPASEGNELIWTVENNDDALEPHARIEERLNDGSYLLTLSEGEVRITCTTKKRNVMPLTMIGFIGDESKLMTINDKIGGSGQNVDSVKYYGEFDLVNGVKNPAVIEFEVSTFSSSLLDGIILKDRSPNLSVDLAAKKITINGAIDGMSFMTLANPDKGVERTYSFKVVKDGVNVYTYDDLLNCTNRSENGEIVVLRKHFESRSKVGNAKNVTMFGSENHDFANEVYKFDTTYDANYIDQWNDFASSNSKYSPINKTILAGLRIQKDFYGNGFTLNLHDLCFPSEEKENDTHDGFSAMLGANDLFRGPKPFYLLGDPNNKPLIQAYGQDNVGVYIDGNNITVNDVKIKNCDFGTILQNLEYTGTVVEVHGKNNSIKNSVLSNGKNVLRSFSSMDLTVDNCILQYAQNFLFFIGANEYEENSDNNVVKHKFLDLDGKEIECTLDEYLTNEGDKLLGYFVSGAADLTDMIGVAQLPVYPKERVQEALHRLQDALARSDAIAASDIRGSAKINDTIFYYGGVASIGVETMFNGPFLYANKPSIIMTLASVLKSFGEEMFPMFPNNVSGASYPVSVELSGNTRFFYDKTLDTWNISGLIGENLSDVISNLGGSMDINIDDIFPLKNILAKVARDNNSICERGGKSYINIPIAMYGGGTNLSSVSESGLLTKGLTDIKDVDLLDSYLDLNMLSDPATFAGIKSAIKDMMNNFSASDLLSNKELIRYIKEVLIKTVTTVTGFESFRFQFVNDPEGLFDEDGNPKVADFTDLQKTFRDKEKNDG